MEKCCLLTLVALLSLISQGFTTRCYICSWSPDDRNNQTDHCTDDNFHAQKVYSHECDHGCEVFVQWDSNGSLEQWRRNCVPEDVDIANSCEVINKIAWKRRICACDTDYCNGVSTLSGLRSLGAVLSFIIVCNLRQ
ncbi:uncharacterized protein LOC143225810 [Tachypleus tridentatus]|uniref:uncharacterized protein LOC143225810 n=1 Tax=Tachypleus tridentatus TaxID=6853 RepID=UPI003FD3B5A7